MKVFFDTSVIFSAIYSQSGGSSKLASFIRSEIITGITTQTIIEELEDNLYKLNETNPKIIHDFLKANNFLVRKSISLSEIEPYQSLVEKKDAHVVAGAILTNCDYLVTLDKKHLNNTKVKIKITQVKILSPKELIRMITK